ncbi:DNA-binding response regulator [Marinomonas sp. MED121]|uniref:response regulator n=1 Tax=Marinomonas sp. MED121 TaxID=314277 RepID=UPI0000690820|nr:response regulator [Marinomonas sp. MED121]EAQ64597.1 DNA-binding response regulator [Marinomonas sp. MED121]
MSDIIRVLVVDDHLEIRTLLAEYLHKHGMRVETADGGESMRQQLSRASFDVIVLDLMMPGEDGLTLCRNIREKSAIPVIMLTAMGEEADRIIGIEMGADDYITKPFSARELLARIKALVKRSKSMPYQGEANQESKQFSFLNWQLNPIKRELVSDQNTIPLSSAEFRLLTVFLENPKHVLSRDQLTEMTKGHTAGVFDRSIDNQISRLRKKIEIDPKTPEILKTVWGGGYIFTEDVVKI